MSIEKHIESGYLYAKEAYAKWGVDVDKVIESMDDITVSLHCWQGDDVGGFEFLDGVSNGGTLVTGNYPGKARNPAELRADLEKAMSLIPGKQKVNIHANYAETDGVFVERDQLEPKHFANWVEWAKQQGIGLDFNPTFYASPKSADGFTLSSADEEIRKYWVGHAIASRKIGAYFGETLGIPCVTNHWIPDGYKDIPVDRYAPRARLKKSLDEIFAADVSREHNLDSIESKLFGIGFESYTVGSSEFYTGYAVKNNTLLTLDAGHYHPTEVISDKISAIMNFVDRMLLHVSRPVRWDSDHVVIFDDELRAIMQEIIRNDFLSRTYIALDFFDASINRVAAWVIGTRNTFKAVLAAKLEPTQMLKDLEIAGDYTSRLAMLEEIKTYPFNAVWDYYCMKQGVPVREDWLAEVKTYEKDVLLKR